MYMYVHVPPRLLTLRTSHIPIGWLNSAALTNMLDRVWTALVFQLPSGWLNDVAPWNMPARTNWKVMEG